MHVVCEYKISEFYAMVLYYFLKKKREHWKTLVDKVLPVLYYDKYMEAGAQQFNYYAQNSEP